MQSRLLLLLPRLAALALAVSIGLYIIVCRSGASNTDELTLEPNAPAQTTDQGPPKDCAGLEQEIRQYDIFLTTSKSGPSPADRERLAAMQARFDKYCR